MSGHWRIRGMHPVLGVAWRRLSWCPALRTAFFYVWHRTILAYWYSEDGVTWTRVG